MNILFVCTGNTCRSPMAEGILKSKKRPDTYARSAGIYAYDGSPASPEAIEAARRGGIDISSHRAKRLSYEDIAWADKIITMTSSHASVVNSFFPDSSKKTSSFNIPDPFGGDIDTYVKCFTEIKHCIDCVFPDIRRIISEKDLTTVTDTEALYFGNDALKFSDICDMTKNPVYIIYGLYDSEKLMSYIVCSVCDDEMQVLSVASVKKLKGYGYTLMKSFLNTAKENGIKKVFLEARKSNTPAINLYNKLGFVCDGIRKNLYTSPAEDGYIMHKDMI